MKRLLFVHLAKTGGTSMRRILRANSATHSFDCIHHSTLIRFREGRRVESLPFNPQVLGHYDVAVLMVRHPLKRLHSCYHYFLKGGLNQRGKGEFLSDTAAQRFLQTQAPTFAECCRQLPEVSGRIPHFHPMGHWLDSLPNPLADLVFTGRQERFEVDLQRLYQLLGLDPRQLSNEHRNSSGVQEEIDWDPLSLRMAESYYASDFQHFGYERTAPLRPRLIQYWDQPSPPEILEQRMKQWLERNKGWEYCCFDREAAARFIGAHYGPELQEAFLDIRLPAMQADVFRIAALAAAGGVWVDAATTCLQPLDSWLDRHQPLLLLRRTHQQHPKVWNGFIHAADPGHPLLVAAWQRISAALLARSGDRVYKHFGPRLLRDLLSGDRRLQTGLEVLSENDVVTRLSIGSSSEALPSAQHWSERQKNESLYLSGG